MSNAREWGKVQFNSAVFVLAFLPVTLILYYLLPGRGLKNLVLLIASLVFYAWGDPQNILLLLFTIFVNYIIVMLMSRTSIESRLRTALLIASVVVDVALLAVFKYTGFVVQNIDAAFNLDFVVPSFALPLGLSYFTLKLVTYAVDVYRGESKVQTDFFKLALYTAMFPSITAGPIVKYETVEIQLSNRDHSVRKVASGLRLFCIGIAKKVLLSNNIAILSSAMLSAGGDRIGAYGAWMGLIAFSFQLYFDFSGYSDMAIGLGRMFGFEFEKNFNYPYISKSVTEFWRRWHISLSTFFREYIYIPMGGSRVKTLRFILNMATVWVLTGVWHGAAWNYIWWGIYYLVVLLIEKFLLSRFLSIAPSFVQHLYVVVVFLFGWCLFWITDTGELLTYLQALLGFHGPLGKMTYWQIGAWAFYPLLAVCAIASTPVIPWMRANLFSLLTGNQPRAHAEGIGIKDVNAESLCDYDSLLARLSGSKQFVANTILLVCDVILIGLFILSMIAVVSGSFSPVIYAAF